MGKAKIKTHLGTLKTHVRDDPTYPGIDIRLERGDKSILLAWVEVEHSRKKPTLKLRLYADCQDNDPTDDRTIVASDLDEYFMSLANGKTELV